MGNSLAATVKLTQHESVSRASASSREVCPIIKAPAHGNLTWLYTHFPVPWLSTYMGFWSLPGAMKVLAPMISG